MSSIESTNEVDGMFINPKDNETPSTLYILTKPRILGLSSSSESSVSKLLKDTGKSFTPFSLAVSNTPAIVNGLFFDSRNLCNLSLNGVSRVLTLSVSIFSNSES